MKRGYFGIAILNTKTSVNLGTLYREAFIFGASIVYVIGHRFQKQCSDTIKSYRHLPLIECNSFDDFYDHLPYDCKLIGVEQHQQSLEIKNYIHPERAIYLLGAEDNGIPEIVLNKCHDVVELPGKFCHNVAVAGALILFDRINKVA